jgi:hypothetical protein
MTTKQGLNRTPSFLIFKMFIYALFGLVLGLTMYIFYDGVSTILSFIKTEILPTYHSLTNGQVL